MWHAGPVHAKLHMGNPQLLLMRADLLNTIIRIAYDKAILDQRFKGHREGLRRRQFPILPPSGVGAIFGFEIRLGLTQHGVSIGRNVEFLGEGEVLGKWLPQGLQGVSIELDLRSEERRVGNECSREEDER